MLLRLALAVVLLLGGAGLPPVATLPSDRTATVPAAHPGITPSILPSGAAPAAGVLPVEDPAPADDVTVTELDVVLPAVEPTGQVVESPATREARAAQDAVVTDRIVDGARVESDVVETDDFQTLGVTWPGDADVDDLGAQVRTRVGGEWSGWVPLEVADDAPDAGTADAANAIRGGTDPLWVGDADAIQLSFNADAEGGPEGMSLALIGSPELPDTSGTASAADVTGASSSTGSELGARYTVQTTALTSSSVPSNALTSTALPSTAAPGAVGLPAAMSGPPRVISRAQWGARAQVCTPDTASSLVGVVVHHTAGSNDYQTQAQAMQQIRNDQRYHIEGRGWCDIGYNFIVDKWGNIYEGRANSLNQPVIGVHAGGFNTGTVGISMLGSYDSVAPSAAVQESVAQVAAWRLRSYYGDPAGSLTYHTLGGENSRYPAGSTVTLPVIFGHRDVAYTACPGVAGYGALPNIRTRARQLVSPAMVNPSVSPSSAAQGGSFVLRAPTISNLNWRLDVYDARTGIQVRAEIGYAQEAFGGVVATWNGRNLSNQPVGPGTYRMRLTAYEPGSGTAVIPYERTVTVTGSQNPPTVSPVALTGDLTFVPITPTRVLDTRPGAQSIGPASRVDVVVAGVGGVPADAKAVAVNITAANASATTHIRAWPAGQPRPMASVLNTDTSRAASAAGVVLGVGGERKISLYNNTGSTHLLVDVTGYYTASSGGSRYEPLANPARVFDTRTPGGGPMTNGNRRTVTVAGSDGVPTTATAVVVNVISVAPTGNGYVAVLPAGASVGSTSSVNHLPGKDVANLATVPLSGGKADVVLAGSTADVVVDVVGWYGPGASSTFTPVNPVRAFDTRMSGGIVEQGETRTFPVSSVTGLPAGASSVMLTLTATQQTAGATYLTAWAAGSARPAISVLNTGRGRDQANSTIARLGPTGAIQAYNNLGQTHLIGDVVGYFD